MMYSRKGANVFKLQFSIDEIVMVVVDEKNSEVSIYEIKHSKERVPEQCKHLIDEEKCRQVSHRYGKIVGKYVIYRGKDAKEGDIAYLNVEKYLKNLKNAGL